MIRKEHLRIYEQFQGNSDVLARAKRRVPQLMTDEEWRQIDTLLRDLFLIQFGLANSDFERLTLAKTSELAEDEFVYQRLVEIARLSSERNEKWLASHNLFR